MVHALMEFLGDSSNSSAVDVIAFVRSVYQVYIPELHVDIDVKGGCGKVSQLTSFYYGKTLAVNS